MQNKPPLPKTYADLAIAFPGLLFRSEPNPLTSEVTLEVESLDGRVSRISEKSKVRTHINSYSHEKQLNAYYFLACTFPATPNEPIKPSFYSAPLGLPYDPIADRDMDCRD